jgi:hypothetical protein
VASSPIAMSCNTAVGYRSYANTSTLLESGCMNRNFHRFPHIETTMNMLCDLQLSRSIREILRILREIERCVHIRSRRHSYCQEFYINHFTFEINRKRVHLKDTAPIQVRVELLTADEFQNNGSGLTNYCTKAAEKDPASRLSILVERTTEP